MTEVSSMTEPVARDESSVPVNRSVTDLPMKALRLNDRWTWDAPL